MNPIQKIVLTNMALGISDIKQNQATTREVWDTIDTVTSPGSLTWFQGCNARTLPATNLTRNRLEVQGNVVVQKIIFGAFDPLESSNAFPLFMTAVGDTSLVNLKIGNSVVLKDIPLFMFRSVTKYTNTPNIGSTGFVFTPLTSIVIPPQIEFELTITPANPNWAAAYETFPLTCSIQGIGTQFSNKNY